MNGEQQKTRIAYGLLSEGEAQGGRQRGLEPFIARGMEESQGNTTRLMEEIGERRNLLRALRRVKANGGSSGIDRMTVNELPNYLESNGERIREQLLEGTYKPQPVRRVEIPKPDGGKRELGIPTVLDRLIQQAILGVLQEIWEREFSEHSYGFRPGHNAHQAVRQAQGYIKEGYAYVVDIDLERFFDTVNHDKLISCVGRKVRDRRVLQLIGRYLRSGAVLGDGVVVRRERGTPQGGPLSPLLSNIYLHELDKELERRGHRFVRYADDCNIYVKSKRASERVKENVSKYIEKKLKLEVNERKSARGLVQERKFLGFSFMSVKAEAKIRIAPESLRRFPRKVKQLTRRSRGQSLRQMIEKLSRYLQGWLNYYGHCQTASVLERLEGWIRHRLRAVIWKQWRLSRQRYKELRKHGVGKELAASTAMSSKGPWRISHCRAMQVAFPISYFRDRRLPELKLITL